MQATHFTKLKFYHLCALALGIFFVAMSVHELCAFVELQMQSYLRFAGWFLVGCGFMIRFIEGLSASICMYLNKVCTVILFVGLALIASSHF